MPTTATAGAQTVTITARDADSNTMNTDRASLTFSVTVNVLDTAPSFGSGSVSNKTYIAGQAITDFTVPAASGGNGAITYAASNLPDGLVFDATGTDTPTSNHARDERGLANPAARTWSSVRPGMRMPNASTSRSAMSASIRASAPKLGCGVQPISAAGRHSSPGFTPVVGLRSRTATLCHTSTQPHAAP